MKINDPCDEFLKLIFEEMHSVLEFITGRRSYFAFIGIIVCGQLKLLGKLV